MNDKEKIEQFSHILWLAAKDLIFFGTNAEYENGELIGNSNTDIVFAVNMNDTFAWACADAEEFKLKDAGLLREIHDKFGWQGLTAWVSIIRNSTPISPLNTPEYKEIRKKVEVYMKSIE